MKKLISLTLTILILLTTACQLQQNILPQQPLPNNAALGQAEDNIKNQITDIIAQQIQYIKELNLEKYISLINPADLELIKEQINWFNDLKLEPVQDFSIKLLGIAEIDDNSCKAEVEQSYHRDGKKISVKYFKRFIKIFERIYDAGNYFEEVYNEHFIVKYTEQNKKLALELLQKLEPIYKEFADRWKLEPERKIVIKMFDHKEELRQSIKLSMWACAGWYEFGESIRMFIAKGKEDVGSIAYIVRHELVHLFTMTKAKGNVAYWLAEGLATNYEDVTRRSYASVMQSAKNRLMSIEQLESIELEKLTDMQDIRNYYINSELVISFIIDKYGEQVLDTILNGLAQMPSLEGTGHENDTVYREYLSQILPSVLGLRSYEDFKRLWQQEIDKVK